MQICLQPIGRSSKKKAKNIENELTHLCEIANFQDHPFAV